MRGEVARAMGQDTTLSDDLAKECLDLVTRMDAMLRSAGVCGPKIDVPEGASLTDRLVGLMGRRP